MKTDRPSPGLSHLDSAGQVRMVDVSAKPVQIRDAVAQGVIRLAPATIDLVREDRVAKGNVFATARIAGILAAKQTAGLIPLCHPLEIEHVTVEFDWEERGLRIVSSVRTVGRTGAEMEALTAVSVAALTIYDMCKAVDKAMVIESVQLVSKSKREPSAG